jgi:hypothetical protein
MNKYLLTILLLTAAVKGHAQSTIIPAAKPYTVLAQFFSALNSQQKETSYRSQGD